MDQIYHGCMTKNVDGMNKLIGPGKKCLRLTKICEKGRKDRIFISFRMFPFHRNIIFSELSFERNCKKAASCRKCIFLREYEIFYVVLLRQQAIFH